MNVVILVDCTSCPEIDAQYLLRVQRSLDHFTVLFFGNAPNDGGEANGANFLRGLTPKAALEEAFQCAADHRAHFLYVAAPIEVPSAVISGLQKRLAEDHMFGAVVPRFSHKSGELVFSLPTKETVAEPKLTRRALAALPKRWIVPELLAGCLLLRRELAANPPLNNGYKSLSGCMLHLLCGIRRRGFRTIVDNRLCISTDASATQIYPIVSEDDRLLFMNTIYTHFSFPMRDNDDGDFVKSLPDTDRALEWYEEHDCHKLESLCVAAFPPRAMKRSILVDCRGMMAFFCGTTVCQLGFLKGLEAFTEEWEIHVLAQCFALEAHELRTRFPKLKFSENPFGRHACVIHMAQPCYTVIIRDLHRHGFITACNMLDTICWDMILGAPPQAQDIWKFASKNMDCIFYNSGFSRKQFNTRFPVDEAVDEVVTYHSFTIEENVSEKFTASKEGDFVLVFGNNYDHKDVFPTVQRLRTLFPELRVVALGPECSNIDNVEFLQSGALPDAEIERLMSSAKVVVFPSWIEGFGLPVIKALAYGRKVLVRAMPLWEEIASQCRLPGKLMAFDDMRSLGQAMTAALKGTGYPEIMQGARINSCPMNWEACAKRILDGMNSRLLSADAGQWTRRNAALRLAELGAP